MWVRNTNDLLSACFSAIRFRTSCHRFRSSNWYDINGLRASNPVSADSARREMQVHRQWARYMYKTHVRRNVDLLDVIIDMGPKDSPDKCLF